MRLSALWAVWKESSGFGKRLFSFITGNAGIIILFSYSKEYKSRIKSSLPRSAPHPSVLDDTSCLPIILKCQHTFHFCISEQQNFKVFCNMFLQISLLPFRCFELKFLSPDHWSCWLDLMGFWFNIYIPLFQKQMLISKRLTIIIALKNNKQWR